MRTGGEMYAVLLPVVGEERAVVTAALYDKLTEELDKGPLGRLPVYLTFPVIAALYGEALEGLRKAIEEYPKTADVMDRGLLERIAAATAQPFEEKPTRSLADMLRAAYEEGGPLGTFRGGPGVTVGHA